MTRKPQNFYFTFGSIHRTPEPEDEPLQNHWVRVIAFDWAEARAAFITHFAVPVMGGAQRWSMQYDQDDWDPFSFPGREYWLIDATDGTDAGQTFSL